MDVKKLIDKAREARENAYAPYSGFKVGAAMLTARGNIYTGSNVENVSYGLTVCAERVAVFKAVSGGERDFEALAVFAGTRDYCSPCGACRQVLMEFGGGTQVYMVNGAGEYKTATVAALMPLAFGREVEE